jgi:Holliday junction resolvase RusA-like endonuclease
VTQTEIAVAATPRRLPLRLVIPKTGTIMRIVGGRHGKDGVPIECFTVGIDEEAKSEHCSKAVVPHPAEAGIFFVGYGDDDRAAARDLFDKVKAADIEARKRAPKSAARAAHKRKTRRPTVATLDISCLADGVIVLCVNDVLTKNDRYRRTSFGQAESALAKAYKAAVALAAWRAGYLAPVKVAATGKHKASVTYGEKTERAGIWSLEVLSVWPTERHLENLCSAQLANGDADAPLSMVRDAMQRAGIIDDDMRIVHDTTHAIYIKDERRTVARLVRMDGGQQRVRQLAIERLLAAEKQAASTVTC